MNKNKNASIIFFVIMLVGIIVWINFSKKTERVEEEQITEKKSIEELEERDDTTTAINEDLEEIDISDLEEDFSDIDKDLEQL
jgi:hypothetical protein